MKGYRYNSNLEDGIMCGASEKAIMCDKLGKILYDIIPITYYYKGNKVYTLPFLVYRTTLDYSLFKLKEEDNSREGYFVYGEGTFFQNYFYDKCPYKVLGPFDYLTQANDKLYISSQMDAAYPLLNPFCEPHTTRGTLRQFFSFKYFNYNYFGKEITDEFSLAPLYASEFWSKEIIETFFLEKDKNGLYGKDRFWLFMYLFGGLFRKEAYNPLNLPYCSLFQRNMPVAGIYGFFDEAYKLMQFYPFIGPFYEIVTPLWSNFFTPLENRVDPERTYRPLLRNLTKDEMLDLCSFECKVPTFIQSLPQELKRRLKLLEEILPKYKELLGVDNAKVNLLDDLLYFTPDFKLFSERKATLEYKNFYSKKFNKPYDEIKLVDYFDEDFFLKKYFISEVDNKAKYLLSIEFFEWYNKIQRLRVLDYDRTFEPNEKIKRIDLQSAFKLPYVNFDKIEYIKPFFELLSSGSNFIQLKQDAWDVKLFLKRGQFDNQQIQALILNEKNYYLSLPENKDYVDFITAWLNFIGVNLEKPVHPFLGLVNGIHMDMNYHYEKTVQVNLDHIKVMLQKVDPSFIKALLEQKE